MIYNTNRLLLRVATEKMDRTIDLGSLIHYNKLINLIIYPFLHLGWIKNKEE